MLPLNDLARHTQAIEGPLRDAIDRVLRRGYYVLGPETTQFEIEFAAYLGVAGAVGVANGTDALELALRAFGVNPGDDVLTVANAGMYATTAIRAVGANPRFVDIRPSDMLIDPEQLADGVTSATTAAIVTHLYGRMADMGPITKFLSPRGIRVVEDCAQAHGAIRDGIRAGAWGELAAFSFYPTKNLGALGDGGAVVAKHDLDLLAKVSSLRQYGWSEKYRVDTPGGRNSRLDELQAAVLRAKLPLLNGWNSRRLAIAERYRRGLADLGWTVCPSIADGSDVSHLFVVRVPDRAHVRATLAADGIATDVHYPIPDHYQPVALAAPRQSLPNTESAAETVLTLPSFPELTDAEIDAVIESCRKAAFSSPSRLDQPGLPAR